MTVASANQQTGTKKKREVYYPSSDGKPMAETEYHRDLMIYFISALIEFFDENPDVTISGNNLLYYVEGNPHKSVSPDCYVVFNVDKRLRDLYKVWEEGKTPSVVFEFTSKTTRREDTEKKRPLYEQILKVDEYFLFDPTEDYLDPILQGYRLTDGVYSRIPLVDGKIRSEQLGLEFVPDGKLLRIIHPDTGQPLLTRKETGELARLEHVKTLEALQLADAATTQANTEARLRMEQEAEIGKLRAELEQLRGMKTNE